MFNTIYRVIDKMFVTIDACVKFVFYYVDAFFELLSKL